MKSKTTLITGTLSGVMTIAIAIAALVLPSSARSQSSDDLPSPITESSHPPFIRPPTPTPLPEPTPPPLTGATPVDAPETQELEASKVDPRRQKFLSLYIGIEHQEKLPYLPPSATFKGDFKKVTKVSINRETSTLLFQATQEGVATLTIHGNKGQKLYEFRIDVKKSNLTKVAQEMRALLSDIEGISIKIINNKVVVDGQVLVAREMNRIISVVNQYGEQIASSLVTLSPLAQRKIAQAIQNYIANPEITVRAVNDKFILEGLAGSQEEKDKADAIAQMYVPDMVKEAGEKDGTIVKLRKTFVLNLITVKQAPPRDPGKIIQLVLHYVELNKNYQKGFRFQFTPGLEDKSTVGFTNDSRAPGSLVSTITGTVSNLLPKLNWAKQHGHARVLESTSLIVLDGQKGDLKSVTNIPYQTLNAQGQATTQFTPAGITSSITPSIINPRSDSIRLQMDFSMSAFLGVSDAGPLISNSALQTTIIVRSGQSAAVGGLISNTANTDYNKLPKGGIENPIISLYASKSFQTNKSQFVVFVTPIIKASASQGAEKIKQKFKLRD
jgi:pilus assembly protein CpaC